MSEMIDRAAKALYDTDEDRLCRYLPNRQRVAWEDDLVQKPHPYHKKEDGESAVTADFYRWRARIVIEAMREPTNAMVRAAEECIFEHMPEAQDWTVTMAKQAIEAAIEEALK